VFPRASSPSSAARLVSWLLLGVLAPAARAQEFVQPRLAAPAPAVAIRPERPPGLDAYGCASCHAEVAAEWAASAHGLSWVDERYQAEMREKNRPELCHGCHAPEPLLAGLLGSKPDTRAPVRELGVHCESCHADAAGVVLGPRGTQVAAHPSKVAPELAVPGSNALCSTCHATNVGPVIGIAKDFAAAGFAARGLSCVGCHMAPVERSWASEAPARPGRSHALQTPRDPAFLRQAFGLALRTDAKGSELVVRNQAGHRVPGLVGRKLTFEAELLDDAGAVLERGKLVLDERAYLPVEGTRSIRFTRAGVSARVKAVHLDPRAPSPVPFLDETVPVR
jgi:cytochrome c554/c'-like protein